MMGVWFLNCFRIHYASKGLVLNLVLYVDYLYIIMLYTALSGISVLERVG